jgi:hypothetical protein
MTGTNCELFTHKSSRSYLNHLVFNACSTFVSQKCLGNCRYQEWRYTEGSPVLIYLCSDFHGRYVKGTLYRRLTVHNTSTDVIRM